MGHVKRAAVLLLFLAVFVLASGGEALAKPDWVSVKYVKAVLTKKEGTTVNDPNHRSLKLYFDIKNNNKNGQIITAFFDRSIRFEGSFTIPQFYKKQNGWESTTWKSVTNSSKYSKPIKGEWYPGQTYRYDVSIPLDKLLKLNRESSWRQVNEGLSRSGFSFKMNRWDFDFQVSTRK